MDMKVSRNKIENTQPRDTHQINFQPLSPFPLMTILLSLGWKLFHSTCAARVHTKYPSHKFSLSERKGKVWVCSKLRRGNHRQLAAEINLIGAQFDYNQPLPHSKAILPPLRCACEREITFTKENPLKVRFAASEWKVLKSFDGKSR